MTDVVRPTKETVRAYMERRVLDPEPPPTIEEIRRQLGWYLIPRCMTIADRPD